tara:strand:- start:19733 stop:20542 length:810 start_codon:yes stop_codon:yes gene_type:complete
MSTEENDTKTEDTTVETPAPKKRAKAKKADLPKDDNGQIDWESLIPDKEFYVNDEAFTIYKKPIPNSTEGLKPYQKIVKLNGLKYIASLRGIADLDLQFVKAEADLVVVKYTIYWRDLQNGMESNVSIGTAGVHFQNVDGDIGQRYMVETAENRAFARAIRNGLRIGSVCKEEISKRREEIRGSKKDSNQNESQNEETPNEAPYPSPQVMLENLLNKYEKKITFDQIKEILIKEDKDGAASVNKPKDISDSVCFELIERINKKFGQTKE